MRIEISGLKDAIGRQATSEFRNCEFSGDDWKASGDVIAKLTGTGTGQFVAEFFLDLRLKKQCVRCLCHFERPLKLDFSREYREQNQATAEEDVVVFSGDDIDVTDVVVEHIILSLPMKPVCGEQCRGLCPVCGRNRNEDNCSCDTKSVDPRLQKLGDLLDQ